MRFMYSDMRVLLVSVIVFVTFRISDAREYLLPGTELCGTTILSAIYRGMEVELDEFPWMALVEYLKPNGQKGFYCGGVLINSRYILTAAHCLNGKDLPKTWKIVSVRLGEHNTDTDIDCLGRFPCAPPPENVIVEETIAHEDYNPFDANQYHDVALLRLGREVEYSDYIRPICLPRLPEIASKSYINEKLTIAGWGKRVTHSESNIKLKLFVRGKSEDICTSNYTQAKVQLNSQYQICAGAENGKDLCRGDSGGSLMKLDVVEMNVNYYSVGIESFGPSPCKAANWSGVYTKVSHYLPWIVSKLRP